MKWLEPLGARPILSCGRMTWRWSSVGDTKVRFYGFPTGASAPVVAPEVAGHRPQAPVEHGTRLVHSTACPSWCRWPWERRSRGPRAAPAGNWGSPAWGWWRGSSRPPGGGGPRAPAGSVERWGGRGQPAVSGTPIGERCRADSPDLLSCFRSEHGRPFSESELYRGATHWTPPQRDQV